MGTAPVVPLDSALNPFVRGRRSGGRGRSSLDDGQSEQRNAEIEGSRQLPDGEAVFRPLVQQQQGNAELG